VNGGMPLSKEEYIPPQIIIEESQKPEGTHAETPKNPV